MEGLTLDAISTVGFPIFAFLLMFWQNTNIIKSNTEVMQKNTEAMQRLADSIDKGGK